MSDKQITAEIDKDNFIKFIAQGHIFADYLMGLGDAKKKHKKEAEVLIKTLNFLGRNLGIEIKDVQEYVDNTDEITELEDDEVLKMEIFFAGLFHPEKNPSKKKSKWDITDKLPVLKLAEIRPENWDIDKMAEEADREG